MWKMMPDSALEGMVMRLRMWKMTPDSALEGTVMVSREAITPGEVEDHLKDMLDRPTGQMMDLVIMYLIPSHPPMRPDAGFIELVSRVVVSFPGDPILDLILVVRSLVFTSEPSICCCQRMSRGGRRTAPRVRRRRQKRIGRRRGSRRGC
jgi:hypothetical protein